MVNEQVKVLFIKNLFSRHYVCQTCGKQECYLHTSYFKYIEKISFRLTDWEKITKALGEDAVILAGDVNVKSPL